MHYIYNNFNKMLRIRINGAIRYTYFVFHCVTECKHARAR